MLTFLLIGALSFGFLILSLLAGHDDVHNALQADHGHGDGSTIWSLQSLFLFGTGIGAVGAIAESYGFGVSASVAIGSFFGAFLAYVGFRVMKALKSTESDSTPSLSDAIGSYGHVVSIINENGYGEVAVVVHGRQQTYRALCDTRARVNDLIRVVAIRGHDVVVEIEPSPKIVPIDRKAV